jgi:hypothetical protein
MIYMLHPEIGIPRYLKTQLLLTSCRFENSQIERFQSVESKMYSLACGMHIEL